VSLRVVGVYLRTIRKIRHGVIEVEVPYVVLAYGDRVLGRLAVTRAVFDAMRAEGLPLLSPRIAARLRRYDVLSRT
jgi:hypothetical protein